MESHYPGNLIMKIAVINDHYSTGPGGQHRIQNLSTGFSRLGHEVTYISPIGMSNEVSHFYRQGVYDEKPSVINSYFSDFFRISQRLHEITITPDLLLIELPNTMLKALTGFFKNNSKLAYDFAGLWTSAFDKNRTYQPIGKAFATFRLISQIFEDSISLLSCKLPDVITVPTTPMKYFVERFFRSEAHLIYHPIDFNASFTDVPKTPDVSMIKMPEQFCDKCLIIIGVKGDGWFFNTLYKIIEGVKGLNVAFIILGSFPIAQSLCSKKGLDDYVFFTGNFPYNTLVYFMSTCNFALVLTHPQIKNLPFSPHNISKIADFLASGKPIITDTINATDYIEEDKTGFFVETIADIVDKIRLLVTTPDIAIQMGENAKKFAREKLDCRKVAEEYIRLIK